MKTKYKWGIIGLGKIANKFATDLVSVPGAQLLAVASRNQERSRVFAGTHNVARSYGSYMELVLDPDVDIIYIATPHVFHYEHTMLCLENKKAVLCEKPFAINTGQVKRMIDKAKKENVFLMEALWTHFLPHYKFLLDMVEEKRYGRILELTADFGFEAPYLKEKRLYNKELGGGSLLDIGIYPVFAALTLLGKPQEIEASAVFCDTGVDESCEIEFIYANGEIAKLSSAINRDLPTTAIIKFELATVTLVSRFHEPTSILIKTNNNKQHISFDVTTLGYNFEASHVQEMLDQNRTESSIMTFEKSLILIELLDEIRTKIKLDYTI